VYENIVELLGGLCGVWKEKVRFTHKIDKVRYLLYDEVVCSLEFWEVVSLWASISCKDGA